MVVAKLGPAEQALVDLARVALTDDVDGLRQLCRRLVRRPPTSTALAAQLKSELAAILAAAPKLDASPLRNASPTSQAATELEDSEASWVQYPQLERPPVHAVDLAEAIASLIAEHMAPERLVPYGLSPSRTVLFTGPPGVGKTLTAAHVASQLKVPLITLNLASLMSSFMGRTGQNLQDVINQATKQPCVLFLDEFDALAKNRDDNSDVGEVKRLANVVLQQLDQWPDGGLLIAATNHPQILDPAVHRRFDVTIQFRLPEYDERLAYIRNNEIVLRANMSDDQIAMLAIVSDGWSPADLQSWINRTARRAVVNAEDENGNHHSVDITDALLSSAKGQAQRWSAGSALRRAQLATVAAHELGWTQRRIADWLGVSHVTIGKDLNRDISRQSGGKVENGNGK